MIVKEMDPMTPATPMEKAGMEAEKTMAFYLIRAFASEPQLHVSNGLRFAMAGDAAQIDHLIVHPCRVIRKRYWAESSTRPLFLSFSTKCCYTLLLTQVIDGYTT